MDRVIREQNAGFLRDGDDAAYQTTSSTAGTLEAHRPHASKVSMHRDRAPTTNVPSRTASPTYGAPALSPTIAVHHEGSAHRTSRGPPAFYTAKHLYRDRLPTAVEKDVYDAHTDAAGHNLSSAAASHPLSSHPGSAPQRQSVSAGASDDGTAPHSSSPPPSPSSPPPAPQSDVLAAAMPGEYRYPTPPWWRRKTAADWEEDSDAAPSAAPSPTPRSAATGKGPMPTEGDERGTRSYKALRAVSEHNTQTPTPRQTPPSRSRTRSAAPTEAPGTPARLAVMTAARGALASPPSPELVDPAMYRRTARRATQPGEEGEAHTGLVYDNDADSDEGDGNRLLFTSARQGGSGEGRHRSPAAFAFYRDASAASTNTTPTIISVVSPTRRAVPRLRIYQESTTHPSGFAVPRRGPGTAAPRTLYNNLAVLPDSIADRSSVAVAAASGHGRASVVYGTANHPSVYAMQAYRRGVAAATGGVDPAHLRDGVLQQRYSRVHSGWVDAVRGGGADGSRVAHTTTRLRRGLAGGGGAPRALALLDPVAGLSRKPNEVPLAYWMDANKEKGKEEMGDDKRCDAYELAHGKTAGSRAPSPSPPPASYQASGNNNSRSSSHDDGSGDRRRSRAQRLCDLAAERRYRATARALRLRSSHAWSGAALSDGDRRLYWAEHAPLHHADVRGLNALLQGVGEAEPAERLSGSATMRGGSSSTVGSVDDDERDGGRRYDARRRDGDGRGLSWESVRGYRYEPGGQSNSGGVLPAQDARYSRSGEESSAGLGHGAGRQDTHSHNAHAAAAARTRSITQNGVVTAEMDPARMQLQAALRQERGIESTLCASEIVPAAYRRPLSSPLSPLPPQHQQQQERQPAASSTVYSGQDSREMDVTTQHEASVLYYHNVNRHDVDDWRGGGGGGGGGADSAADRSMGLVDSYLDPHTSYVSEKRSAATAEPHPYTRRDFTAARQDDERRATTGSGRFGDARSLREEEDGLPLHSSAASYPSLLFPPMLTPLLQEVDECLRFHGLPTLLEVWRWSVPRQTALLRSAGFADGECRLIVWELERMIRVTSTTCAVAV